MPIPKLRNSRRSWTPHGRLLLHEPRNSLTALCTTAAMPNDLLLVQMLRYSRISVPVLTLAVLSKDVRETPTIISGPCPNTLDLVDIMKWGNDTLVLFTTTVVLTDLHRR